jgi:hypothetical protein
MKLITATPFSLLWCIPLQHCSASKFCDREDTWKAVKRGWLRRRLMKRTSLKVCASS